MLVENPFCMELMRIRDRIVQLRGRSVILDFDLAPLYNSSIRQLKTAVSRQGDRFPGDFSFQLSKEEWAPLRRQLLQTGLRRDPIPLRAPVAFTDGGLIMLASLLGTARAVEMNVQLVRSFIALHHQDDSSISSGLPPKYDDLQQAMLILLDTSAEKPSAFIGIRKR